MARALCHGIKRYKLSLHVSWKCRIRCGNEINRLEDARHFERNGCICCTLREDLLVEIAEEFVNQYNRLKGIQKASLTTSYKLGATEKKNFQKILADITGKDIELEEKIDKEIIGGFILKTGDKQIDSSVKSKIQKLSVKFTDNPYVPKI